MVQEAFVADPGRRPVPEQRRQLTPRLTKTDSSQATTYGHYAGDAVLSTFAEIIRRNVRKGDIVARTGGEEFVLVLDHISEEEAFAFSERVRRAVETGRFPGVSAMEPVTCSFGLARALPGEPFWTTVRRADKALYQAKRSGRNQTRAEWQADNHADARA